MKHGDFTGEIMWLEKQQADIQAGRVRIRQALAGGCREFSDERGRVATVKPKPRAVVLECGELTLTVNGGSCSVLRGLQLTAEMLHAHGFTRPVT